MRKVKILALLLAALMVVAAFAGCANKELEADVVDLDERVTALEGKVDEVGTKVDESNSSLQAILDQLNKLEQDLKDTNDKVNKPVDTADLQKLADEYGAKIGRIQIEVTENKVHYLAADYVAIQEALAAAETEISAAGSSEAMATRYNALLKTLEGYVRVDTKFYNYYLELKGNYTGDDDCLDKVEVAIDYYDEVVEEHYADTAINLATYEYKTGEVDKKGNDVTVKLPALKEEMEGWDGELIDVKDDAADIVAAIEDIEPDDTYAELAVIYGNYVTWKKAAEALSPVHVALVTNYDKLVAAQAASLNYSVASTLIANLKIDSVLDDAQVGLFDDYNELVGYGSHVLFVAVNGSGAMILDADNDPIMVADVYANIDNAIEKWVKENDITEDVAEYIINATFGSDDYFYAKYLNAKAFAADMAAEFESFKKGPAANIKALNSKRLSDSQNLVAKYQDNADAINAWFDKAVADYKAACTAEDKADRTAIKSRAVLASNFETVFTANFNEMVALADLGQYDKVAKAYKIDGAAADAFNGGFVGSKDTTNANFNYIKFYDFVDDEAVEFLTTTYVEAKGFADAINNKVATFPVLQQISVVEYLTTVGGYYGAPTTDADGIKTLNVLATINVSDNEIVDDKGTADTSDDEVTGYKNVTTVADYMAIYGKGGAAYAANSKADLSGLIDVAAYKAQEAAVFARIEAINTATAALNEAYDAVFGTFDEAIITTANVGDVAELVKAINAWKTAGGRADAEITTQVKTVDGLGVYELNNIVASYDSLAANSTFEAIVKKAQSRALTIVREAELLVSLYKSLDDVNKFSAITVDSLTETATLNNSNFAITNVEQSAKNADDQWGWNVSYITYDADKDVFTTKTAWRLNGYDSASSKNDVLKSATYVNKFTALLYTGNTNVNATLDTLEGQWKTKAFKVTDLIEIATKLYDKFMVDNYGVEYTAVETAKATFAADKNGYELKGWIVSIAAKLSTAGYDVSSIKTVTTLDALTTNLNAAAKTLEGTANALTASVEFGGYTYAQITSDFALSSNDTTLDAAGILAKLGIEDATDYDVPAYVVWELVSGI